MPDTPFRRRMLLRTSALCLSAAALAAAAGCALDTGRADFDRHRLTEISPATAQGEYFYDVTLDPAYPADSPAAEAVRRRWLDDWMTRRGFCPQGYRVLERRPFRPEEDNPYQADLRYRVGCTEGRP